MRSLHRCVERALALSLALTAAGALGVAGSFPASAGVTDPVQVPVGGYQLAAQGVIVNLAPGVPPPPAMTAASFLLADMDTGQILVARTPHARHLPASTLKTLTALTLIPLLNPDAKILVSPQDVSVTGTHLGIEAGTTYTVGTLMQGMLMASGNDAAYALARGGRGTAATLAAMNANAAKLGALDTVAKDPSGLDHAGQSTSAYDLALIGRAAMKLPAFRRYAMTKEAVLPGGRAGNGKPRPGFKVSNHNRLLFNYPGAVGVKNGYTVAAKFTYIEAATRGGHTYLMTEMANPKGSWRPQAALLSWAFAYGPSLTPIGELVEPDIAGPPKPSVSNPPARATPTAALPQPRTTTPSTRERARQPALSASVQWVGLAGGISVLALVGVWARRSIARRRP